MQKLIDQLNQNKMTMIVALAKNEPALAEAAIKAGADALQLHINLPGFGDFRSERSALADIVELSDVPVGIVPGGPKKCASKKEVEEMVKMGFDFINMDMENLPPFANTIKGLSKVLALGSRFTVDLVLGVQQQNAQAVDATIIPSSGWGGNLIVGDLQNYISIVMAAGIPVIVPTERRIHTSEVAIISDTGAKGIILTPLVTGTTAKRVEKVTREFRVAVDDLGD